jgi:antitoxin HicB
MGKPERPKWAGAHESKLGNERVSNPGIILGRCLQCGLRAIGIAVAGGADAGFPAEAALGQPLTLSLATGTLIFVKRKFHVTVLEHDEGVSVGCPELPGCHSQGANVEEALANIRYAIQGYVESLRKHGESIPEPVTARVVEVSV